jgi:hypothetical protein
MFAIAAVIIPTLTTVISVASPYLTGLSKINRQCVYTLWGDSLMLLDNEIILDS